MQTILWMECVLLWWIVIVLPFYRTMQRRAQYWHGKLSVCDFEVLEYLENNFMAVVFGLCDSQYHGSAPKGTPKFLPEKEWSMEKWLSA